MVAIKNDLFGELKQGRLGRLAFVLYLTAIHLSVFAYAVAVGVGAGLAERATDLDLDKAQQQLSDYFSMPFMVITAIFLIAVVYAQFNILAKRVRDIGYPGWWALLAYVVVRMIISSLGYSWVGVVFELVAITLLCAMPSVADTDEAAT